MNHDVQQNGMVYYYVRQMFGFSRRKGLSYLRKCIRIYADHNGAMDVWDVLDALARLEHKQARSIVRAIQRAVTQSTQQQDSTEVNLTYYNTVQLIADICEGYLSFLKKNKD